MTFKTKLCKQISKLDTTKYEYKIQLIRKRKQQHAVFSHICVNVIRKLKCYNNVTV